MSPEGLRLAASRLKGCAQAELALKLQFEELTSILAHRRKTYEDLQITLNSIEKANPQQPTPTFSIDQGRVQAQQSNVQKSEAALSYRLEENALKIYGHIHSFAERVLALVKYRRPADSRMQAVHLQQVLSMVARGPCKRSSEDKRLRRRSSYRSTLECEDEATTQCFAHLVKHCLSIFPRDHPYCDFAIHTMSTVSPYTGPYSSLFSSAKSQVFFHLRTHRPHRFPKKRSLTQSHSVPSHSAASLRCCSKADNGASLR